MLLIPTCQRINRTAACSTNPPGAMEGRRAGASRSSSSSASLYITAPTLAGSISLFSIWQDSDLGKAGPPPRAATSRPAICGQVPQVCELVLSPILQPQTWTPGHGPNQRCNHVRIALLAPHCSLPRCQTPGSTTYMRNKCSQAAHLDCCAVALQTDDLPNELVIADTNQLVHRRASHVVCNDDRARHLPDIPEE